MAQSPLNDFISLVKLGGLARTNRYTVLISNRGERSRDVLMLCDQIQIPGTNFNTSDMRTYGETRKAPYERLFDDVNMSFYVDTSMTVKTFFDDWITSIQNPGTRNFNYYDNYTCDIIIEVQDLKNNSRYGVKLYEAFPKSIGTIQLDYAGKDIMKLSVNFAYKYYYVGKYTTTYNEDQYDGSFYPYQFEGDTPSAYNPIFIGDTVVTGIPGYNNKYNPVFNETPSATKVQNDPLNKFVNRLKNFAIGAVGSKIVTKIPGILKR